MRDLIHFAHGNGFPSLCYKQFLDQLAVVFDVCYPDMIGHHPDYPVTENWHHLVDEVIDSVEQQARQKVIAVGHSLGGVLSLLAAIERPDLFKAVVLLDSPLLGRFKSSMVHLAKVLGIIDRVTPAYRTKGRRTYWQDHDQLLRYLKTRDLFKTFTDECLDDYIKYGLDLKEDGYHLKFDRHIESQIYRTIPHVIPRLKGRSRVPAALIYGDSSTVIDSFDVRYMRRYFHIKSVQTKGTHLFPMEHPKSVAKQVIDVVDAILHNQKLYF
ncbi:alpha/beta fold hydrolase [Legionella worsleiensis]|uniref:Hydrolase/acyltransferase n=1 Tax=Legionella worsleiensis TaxID=45076 RepID=A0A0W1A457_9GAMM|nr:alpha/beta hydrolase [Legionella worsleiensis]KTD76127.1 hydrolase/acyltransferase [Legionella worsleiensis]STY33295.1 hydrolases or acyltransferases (alpha/beta hydrolase superfamily) [Legionella worsleiensis]